MKLFWSCKPLQISDQLSLSNQMMRKEGINFSQCGLTNYTQLSPAHILINTSELEWEKTYQFNLEVTKDERHGTYIQEIKVLPGSPPDAKIMCYRNCEFNMDVLGSMVLKASCESCSEEDRSKAQFRWQLKRELPSMKKAINIDDLDTMTTGDLQSSQFLLKPDGLDAGYTYQVQVAIDLPGQEPGVAAHRFHPTPAPSGGQCTIDKLTGVSMITPFTITCTGWLNPMAEKGLDGSQLSYTIILVMDISDDITISKSQNQKVTLVLPPGEPTEDYHVELIISISNIYGAASRYSIGKIKVMPPEEDMETLKDLILNNDGHLDQRFATSDISQIMPLMWAASSLSKKAKKKVETKTVAIAIYEKLSRILSEIAKHAQLPEELVMISKQLKSIRPDKPSIKTKESMKATVIQLYKKITKDHMRVEDRDKLLKDSLDTIGYLLATESTLVGSLEEAMVKINEMDDAIKAANDADGIESPKQAKGRLDQQNKQTKANLLEAKKQAERFSQDLFTMVKNLIGTLAEGRHDIECSQTADTPHLTVHVQKMQRQNHEVNCPFPELSLRAEDIEGCDGCIVGEAKFTQNPLAFSPGSSDVTSDVSMLIAKDSQGKDLSLKSGAVIEVRLTQIKDAKPQATLVNQTHRKKYIQHRVTVNSDNLHLEITLTPSFTNVTYGLWLSLWDETANATMDMTDLLERVNSSDSEQLHYQVQGGRLNKARYYVGVHNYDISGQPVPLQPYSISFRLLGCFQNPKELEWTPFTCELKIEHPMEVKRSLSTHLKDLITVRTNHTGTFAAGLFIPPNVIDFSEVFRDLGGRIVDSPVVLSLVVIITCVYILLLVWARHQDQKDFLKVSVFPATGNNICYTKRYRLYIHTGLRQGASTTSRVYIRMTGELASTTTRRLDGYWHNGFGAGTVIMYEVTTPEFLGPLLYLQVWIDNSGKGGKKDWYLDELLVEDMQTRSRYWFICHQWLSIERGDGSLQRNLAVAGDENKKDFLHLMQAWFRNNLFDTHLWLSVWNQPRRSNFTRIQRVTCCYTLLLLMMVVNAMWYSTGEEEREELFKLEFGPLVITYSQLYTSLVSSLIMFPISLVIVQAFRRTDGIHRNLSETIDDLRAYRRRHLVNKNFQASVRKSINGDPDMYSEPVWKATSQRKWPYICAYIGWTLCVVTSFLSAFFTIMYSLYWGGNIANQWLASFLLCAAQSISVISVLQVLMVVFILSLLSKVPEEELEDEELIHVDDPETRLVDLYVHNNPHYLFEGVQNHIKHAPNVLEKLDHQIQMLDVLVQKSVEEWDYATSTISDPASSIIDDEILAGDSLNMTLSHDIHAEGPPQGLEAEKMRKDQLLLSKFKATLKEAAMRVIYISLLFVILFGMTNQESLVITNHIKSIFSKDNTEFHHLSGPKAFWHWTENTLLPGLYAPSWYNGQPATWRERLFIKDRQAFRLGPIRLRQLRIIPAGCPLVAPLNPILIECNPEYSFMSEDTKNYFPNWLSYPDNDTEKNQYWWSPFIYHSALDLKTLPIMGKLYTYSGGGYVVDLPEEMDEVQPYINKLKKFDWLNLYTRAIFIEVTLYNANANLFINVVLLFELPPSGGSLTKFFVDSFRVYGMVGSQGVFVFVSCILFVMMLLVYTGLVLKAVCAQRKGFFLKVSNIIDLVQVITAFLCVVTYITRLTIVNKAVTQVFSAKGTFVNFYPVSLVSQSFVTLVGVTIFLSIIRFLSMANISYRFRVAGLMLSKGKAVLGSSVLHLFILMTAFSIFFYMHYGVSQREYSSILKTAGSLFALYLGGGSDFKAGHAIGEDELGRVFFFLFATSVSILFTNFFIGAILNIYSLTRIQLQNEEASKKYDIKRYIAKTTAALRWKMSRKHKVKPFN